MLHNINMVARVLYRAALATILFTSSLWCQQESLSISDNTLILVSASRIEEKKTAWQSHVATQRIKRGTVYTSAALLVLWGIYNICWKEAPKDTMNAQNTQQPTMAQKQHSLASDDFFRQQFEYSHSMRGIFFNTLSQSVAFGLAGACVTLLMSAATSSGSVVLEQLKQAFGFGQENIFLDIVNNSLYTCRQLAKSTRALSDDAITSSDTSFQEMWYKSVLVNITTYHFACIHAFEEWVAFVTVLLESKGCEPEVTAPIQQSILTITTMLSMVIKKEHDMLTTHNFNKETTEEISYMLHGICQGITECSYHVGSLCYDHAFSLEKP